MAEPPFLGLEEPKAEVCFRSSEPPGVFSEFGVSGRKICCGAPKGKKTEESNRGSGAPERKICCGAPKTSQSGASAGKLHIDAPKGSEMNVKMTEAGHTGRKHSLMPRRMI